MINGLKWQLHLLKTLRCAFNVLLWREKVFNVFIWHLNTGKVKLGPRGCSLVLAIITTEGCKKLWQIMKVGVDWKTFCYFFSPIKILRLTHFSYFVSKDIFIHVLMEWFALFRYLNSPNSHFHIHAVESSRDAEWEIHGIDRYQEL